MATKSNKQLLIQYAGYSFQMAALLGILVFTGYGVDKWLLQQKPIAIIALPLIGIIAAIVKVINDTKKK
jgi:F0F1-type ATP synthase assembly protein I